MKIIHISELSVFYSFIHPSLHSPIHPSVLTTVPLYRGLDVLTALQPPIIPFLLHCYLQMLLQRHLQMFNVG